MKLLCDIYKSSRKEEMYLYVKKSDGMTKVPETLLEHFGKPGHVMTIVLHPERKLARVDIHKVLEQLENPGFYLQLPPTKDGSVQVSSTQDHLTKDK